MQNIKSFISFEILNVNNSCQLYQNNSFGQMKLIDSIDTINYYFVLSFHLYYDCINITLIQYT